MKIFFFGMWDMPITSYLLVYLALGVVGFLAAYVHRYLLGVIVPIIIWFAISDFREFYRSNIGPDPMYVFQVTLSMILAVTVSVYGAFLQRRRVMPYR